MYEDLPAQPEDPEAQEAPEVDLGGAGFAEPEPDEPTEGEDSAPDPTGAWVGYDDQPVLVQMEVISHLAQTHSDRIVMDRELLEAGVEEIRDLRLPFDLNNTELGVVEFGLHLAGFFSERAAEVSQDLLVRLAQAIDENPPSAEVLAKVDEAQERIAEQRLADVIGVPVEEVHEAVERATERLIGAGESEQVDGEPSVLH